MGCIAAIVFICGRDLIFGRLLFVVMCGGV